MAPLSRLFASSLALLVTAGTILACSVEETGDGSSESDLTADASAPPRDSGSDARDAQAGQFPGGYECDPLKNVGCPSGQACALSYDRNQKIEKVACKSTSEEKFCGTIFDWEGSHIVLSSGAFVGMQCLLPSGFPMAACRPLGGTLPMIGCPLASQFCVPNENGTYGFCERHL